MRAIDKRNSCIGLDEAWMIQKPMSKEKTAELFNLLGEWKAFVHAMFEKTFNLEPYEPKIYMVTQSLDDFCDKEEINSIRVIAHEKNLIKEVENE